MSQKVWVLKHNFDGNVLGEFTKLRDSILFAADVIAGGTEGDFVIECYRPGWASPSLVLDYVLERIV
jgi:hypothetical protein